MDGIFLVLEPNNHVYQVIEAAHRRGLTVVVCHERPVSPPAPYDRALSCISHYIPVEGWKDERAVFAAITAWCGPRPVRGTYAVFELTLRTEVLLRQHYGLPGTSPERMDFLLDKVRVREALSRASLSRLRVIPDDEIRRLSEWPFPGRAAFLKPINGSGSMYVWRCTTLADVREHLAEWDDYARHMRRCIADHMQGGLGLMLEEEAVGDLVSLEGYCCNGRYVPIGITDRTELIAPVPAGEIELVEMNPRFAGGDILALIDRALGIQLEDDLLKLAIGEEPVIEIPAKPVCYVCGQDVMMPADVRQFESIEIPDDDVFFKKVLVKPGATLKSINFQHDQIAQFAFTADTYAGALARANTLRAGVAVNGSRLGDDANNVVIHYGERWASSF
jgi:hypothetical protein